MKFGNDSNRGVLQEWEIEKQYYGDKILFRLCQSWEIPTVLSVLYIFMVFGGQNYMKERNSFQIRTSMFMWSSILAVFSIVGSYRTVILAIDTLRKDGIQYFVCNQNYFDAAISRVWASLFAYSKFLEYVDTAFIIFRKQPLIFLHWYHHVTVALFCWLMYGGRYAGGYPFMTLNFIVHAFMYTYYAVRAAGFRPPRFVSVGITFLQIVQMVLGCMIMGAVVVWANPSNCTSSTTHQLSGSIMYFSYLVLFVHFFYNSYVKKRKSFSTGEKSSASDSMMKNGVPESKNSSQSNLPNGSYNLRKRNK